MSVLQNIEPKRVFEYFEEISAVPRGSGNMEKISDYCMKFAAEHSLKAICDEAKNVVIYKNATKGYENSEPVILQGHLDMVCQKTAESDIDFDKDGISLKIDGDTIYADGTTLGADNGIAVAMILAILGSDDIPHPPIEAVFTVNEEVGMLGAIALDTSVLSGKRMINLDSEEDDCMTVSCAGGSDFSATLSVNREQVNGTMIQLTLKGLRGGHSGVCIHEGRVNANILAGRFLKTLADTADFEIISVDGGDKANAIPPICIIQLCTDKPDNFIRTAKDILEALRFEIHSREPSFGFDIEVGETGIYDAISKADKQSLIYALVCTPDGVMDMSADIAGLVETSLNLGILKTDENQIYFKYALRSNIKSVLRYLEEKITVFYSMLSAKTYVSGQYPPWEFQKDSILQKIYKDEYFDAYGKKVRVEALHAGLECGVFADKISGLDCIAIGPQADEVHTVNERLSVSSVEKIYTLLKNVLTKCK